MTEEEIEEQAVKYRRENYDLHSDPLKALCEQSWIDGAKWGMEHAIEWHDLRKNPDDLPSHSGLYCAQNGEVREFDKEEKSWFTVHFEPCMNCTEETFLWCELPQFKDKE